MPRTHTVASQLELYASIEFLEFLYCYPFSYASCTNNAKEISKRELKEDSVSVITDEIVAYMDFLSVFLWNRPLTPGQAAHTYACRKIMKLCCHIDVDF